MQYVVLIWTQIVYRFHMKHSAEQRTGLLIHPTYTHTHLLRFAACVYWRADSSIFAYFIVGVAGSSGWWPGSAVSCLTPGCVHTYFHSCCIKWLLNGSGHLWDGPGCFCSLTAAVSPQTASMTGWFLFALGEKYTVTYCICFFYAYNVSWLLSAMGGFCPSGVSLSF